MTHFPTHHKEPEIYHKQADGGIRTDQALPYQTPEKNVMVVPSFALDSQFPDNRSIASSRRVETTKQLQPEHTESEMSNTIPAVTKRESE